ncbi:hypothetical protein M569_11919, partial [Genlisea aurea]
LTALKDFARQGQLSEAFSTLSLIQGHTLTSTSCNVLAEAFSVLLLTCTNVKLLLEGTQLHAQVISSGYYQHPTLISRLVFFYTAFDLFDDADYITFNSNSLDPIPWNVLISSYANRGHFQKAIFVYEEMCRSWTRPDSFTYPSVLKVCAELLNLDYGREVHKSISACSLDCNVFIQNALVSMYGKCGDIATARSIFDKMDFKDDVSWNSMISVYASAGKWAESVELFKSMCAVGVKFNSILWNTVAGGCSKMGMFRKAIDLISEMRLKVDQLDEIAVIIGLGACSRICALRQGKEIHSLAIRTSRIDFTNVGNALIAFYSRCQQLTHAYIVFRSIEKKAITTWNSIISGFVQYSCSEEAAFLFRELLLTGTEPNHVTLASILSLCARVSNLRHGKELHGYLVRRREFEGHLLLWNSLVDVYGRSGRVPAARKLFDSLDRRDVVTYTSMISGYGMQGNGKLVVDLLEEMEKAQIKPDEVAMVAILSACSHSGMVSHGRKLFEKMQTVYGLTPTLNHYACMSDLFGRAGLLTNAKEIILRMPYEPTAEIWATLIGACRIHGNTEVGEWAADKLLEMKSRNSGYYVLIANMYAAAGYWSKLAEVRSYMKDLGVSKDPGCAWVDLGGGFTRFLVEDASSNGHGDEIFHLLRVLAKHIKD